MDFLEGVKAAVEVDMEAQVEVSEECFEGFGGIVVYVSEPGFSEGCMFGVLNYIGKVKVCQLVVVGEYGFGLVGCDYGVVEVGGDDARVYVVS